MLVACSSSPASNSTALITDEQNGYLLKPKEQEVPGKSSMTATALVAAEIVPSAAPSTQIQRKFASELRILNACNMKREIIRSKTGSLWYCQGIYNNAQPGKYAILVFLHGIGERGDDNVASIRLGISDIVKQIRQSKQKVILIAPQCPSNQTWTALHRGGTSNSNGGKLDMIPILIRKKIKEFDVDPDRIYITGLSMGGDGTWALLSLYGADLFAAGIPCGGGGDPAQAEKMKALPIWIFHGESDPTVPVELSRSMYTALKKAGNDQVFYQEYPGVTHDCWTRTYRNPEVWKWLFSQKRGTKSNIQPVQGKSKQDIQLVLDNDLKQFEYRSDVGHRVWYCEGTYNMNASGKPAILLFLHGGGERGNDTDNASQVRLGLPAIISAIRADPTRKVIVLAPQCPSSQSWGGMGRLPEDGSAAIDILPQLIDAKIKEYNADPDRVYITGFSMGGIGTLEMCARRPDLYAAAVAICCGGSQSQADKMVNIPTQLHQGADDPTVRPERTRAFYDMLKNAGGKVTYTEYPGVGHNSWDNAYADKDTWIWLFAQKRSK